MCIAPVQRYEASLRDSAIALSPRTAPPLTRKLTFTPFSASPSSPALCLTKTCVTSDESSSPSPIGCTDTVSVTAGAKW